MDSEQRRHYLAEALETIERYRRIIDEQNAHGCRPFKRLGQQPPRGVARAHVVFDEEHGVVKLPVGRQR